MEKSSRIVPELIKQIAKCYCDNLQYSISALPQQTQRSANRESSLGMYGTEINFRIS